MINNEMFFNLLKDSTYDADNVDKKICYITNEDLTDTSVSLPCNHSFNYYPLYQEIIKQKCSIRNRMNHLSLWMIECPYCRQLHNGILPYKKLSGVRRIRGVNSPKEWILITKKCKECNEPCIDEYCSKGCNKLYNQCRCLIKSKLGSRRCHNKGLLIIENEDSIIKLCGIHYNQYNKKGITGLNLLK
jgi:hypothetical protein